MRYWYRLRFLAADFNEDGSCTRVTCKTVAFAVPFGFPLALYRQLKRLLHDQFLREAERAAEEKSKFRKIIDKITARW